MSQKNLGKGKTKILQKWHSGSSRVAEKSKFFRCSAEIAWNYFCDTFWVAPGIDGFEKLGEMKFQNLAILAKPLSDPEWLKLQVGGQPNCGSTNYL